MSRATVPLASQPEGGKVPCARAGFWRPWHDGRIETPGR